MFDHVGIVVKDLQRGARCYGHVLAPLGLRILEQHHTGPGEGWVVIGTGLPESPFFVVGAGRPSFWDERARPAVSPIQELADRRIAERQPTPAFSVAACAWA